MKVQTLLVAVTAMLLATAAAASEEDIELQKKLANPVADLITVPIQYNANFNAGPLDKTQHTINIQPVYSGIITPTGTSLATASAGPSLSA